MFWKAPWRSTFFLADEIKMLEDYLSLELLRFDNSFSYNITIDEAIDPEEIEIPSIILQPFVENALIHGLLPKKSGPKQLDIIFNTDSNYLICIVDDTGVGRLAANEGLHIYQNEKNQEVSRSPNLGCNHWAKAKMLLPL